MNKRNNTSKKTQRNCSGRELNRLIVRRLTREIKRQGAKCRKQGKVIFKKLKQVDESIEIIAREIARQIKGNERY